jgi:hypothetical protein
MVSSELFGKKRLSYIQVDITLGIDSRVKSRNC